MRQHIVAVFNRGSMMRRTVLAVSAIATLAGCASKPSDIAPSYVSSYTYEGMPCNRLAREAEAVSSRAAVATGAQEKKRSQDGAATAVAVVLFWPAAFMIKGDGAQAAEVARLKGEMQAIQDVSRRKGCKIQFQTS